MVFRNMGQNMPRKMMVALATRNVGMSKMM